MSDEELAELRRTVVEIFELPAMFPHVGDVLDERDVENLEKQFELLCKVKNILRLGRFGQVIP